MALTQISTAGVKDNAVTAGKIPADAIGSSEIAANAVGSSELADNAVDTAAIADDAVTTAKIAAGNITATELGSNSVTGAKIAAGAINNANKLQDSIVTGAKIGSGTIVAGNLATDAVTTAKIANDAVTGAKLADNAVVRANITDGEVISAKLDSNAVTTSKINNNAVTTAKIADSAVTDAKIASGISASKITGLATDSITEGDSKVEVIDSGSNGNIQFVTDNTTRAQLKTGSSCDNQLLIGTSGSSNQDIDVGVCIGSSSFSRPGVILRGNTSNKGDISFCDNSNTDSSDGVSEGLIRYDHATDHMEFHTADVERMRIDSNGTLIIGATSYGGGGSTPAFYISNSSGRQAKIHNTSNSTSSLQITNSGTGQGEDAGMMYATLGSSLDGWICNAEDANIRFGTNNSEKLRIQAAGGISFNGDTASSNALDDYEEGTWTPTLDGNSYGGNSYGYQNQYGNYTKIGNLVTISCYITWNNFNGSGHLHIAGLPFSVKNSNLIQHAGPAMLNNMNWPQNANQIVTHNWYGISYFRLYSSSSNGTWDAVQCDGAAGLICTLTYFTA